MDLVAMKFIGVGLMSFAMLGAAMGVGKIFASLLDGIARNPSATADLQKYAFIGAGLAEAMGLFAFVIAMLLMFVV
jgi:F-type H+-transporting ATPase subunit c